MKNTGLTRQLREFFESNPAEQLSQEQIAQRFNAQPGTVRNMCCTLHKHGVLKRTVVYSLDTDVGALPRYVKRRKAA